MALEEIIPEKHKILSNGAIYDKEQKRIIAMRPELAAKNTQITQANASALQAQRMNKKRERVQQGALAFVRRADPETWGEAEDEDWIEAVAEAQMAQALRIGDAGMTRAADWLVTNAGLSEKQAQDAPQQAVTDTVNALSGLLQAITAAMQAGQERDVVEGSVTQEQEQAQAADSSEGEGGV